MQLFHLDVFLHVVGGVAVLTVVYGVVAIAARRLLLRLTS